MAEYSPLDTGTIGAGAPTGKNPVGDMWGSMKANPQLWLNTGGIMASALGLPGAGAALSGAGGIAEYSGADERAKAWLEGLKKAKAEGREDEYKAMNPLPRGGSSAIVGTAEKVGHDREALAAIRRAKQPTFGQYTPPPIAIGQMLPRSPTAPIGSGGESPQGGTDRVAKLLANRYKTFMSSSV